ncbi:MAG: response regulator transcription factor [Ignavibacteria bacterium]
MIKILIGDDHSVVRQGLKQILSENKELYECAEAENGQQVLDMLFDAEWDVIILDISMPGLNGLDVLKSIRRIKPKLPVLVLTMYSEDQFAIRSIKAGASGYLTKDSAPEELVKAVKKLLKGEKYVSLYLAEILATDIGHTTEGMLHKSLSDREFQVMRLIASGKTTGETGDNLGLSAKTISTYRTRILHKMGMTSNAELTRYAVQNKLIM